MNVFNTGETSKEERTIDSEQSFKEMIQSIVFQEPLLDFARASIWKSANASTFISSDRLNSSDHFRICYRAHVYTYVLESLLHRNRLLVRHSD